MSEFKFQTREEIDKAIGDFARILSKDYNEIKEHFFNLFGFYPIPVNYWKKDLLHNVLTVFRTRNSLEVIDNTNVSEFSCPPLDLTIPTKRANWTGRNVFYASDRPYTSIIESKSVSEGDEFYVSQWGFYLNRIEKNEIRITTLAIDNISEDNPWKLMLGGRKDFYDSFKKEMSDKEADLLSYLIHKMSSLFTELDESKYSLTAFIADQRIYSKMNTPNELMFPILIFPSVAHELGACNFAIHPKFVEVYMRLEKVIKYRVTQNLFEGLKCSYSEIGIPTSNEKVKWYNIDFERENAKYQIESIKCGCGENIEISDLNKLLFKRGDIEINHSDIVSEALQNFDFEKIYKLDEMFEKKGLTIATTYPLLFSPIGISVIVNEKIHSNLTIEIKLVQPLTYKEIEYK